MIDTRLVVSVGLEVSRGLPGVRVGSRLTFLKADDLRSNGAERVLILSVTAQCGVKVCV